MLPTPTTQEFEHKDMELTHTNRRKTKDGKNSHSLNLADTVRMWPTPTQDSATERTKNYAQGGKPLTVAVQEEEIRMWPKPRVSDTEGGVVKNVELKDGNFSRTNKKGVRWGVKLKDAVSHVEKQKNMFPTPSSRDWKGGHGTIVNEDGKYYRVSNTTGTKWGARLDAQIEKMESEKQEMLPTPQAADNRDRGNMSDPSVQRRIKIGKQVMLSQKVKKTKGTGSLNPDWVEWLMGYGQGYTDPDNKDKFTLDSHQGFPNEPEIARVTTENQYRKDRLKALGNSIVPQIAYHIGLAILEQEKT